LRNSKPDSQSPEHRFFLIDKFQFNDKCSTTDHLKVQLSVDWTPEDKIKIIIPALIPVRDIYAPPYTSSIEWFIQLSSIPLHAYTTNYIESTTFSMPYDEKPVAEKILELQFRHRPGHFSIAFFSLRFTLTRGSQSIVMQDEEWTPAGVIGSHYVEEIKK
jgi:hypothetical protein